ncbi:hypothetical protein Y032_0016g3124 [Ancylostoma ceylanicum]|uniref:Uncharacterized protein n=1 Tax=Ancylostoma ceylanicum TaxID=53326 RepID=A0A016V774_9BILA|nr:hypothetical protein Y032_0016g3124 [Ancylostoma ceylanicum]
MSKVPFLNLQNQTFAMLKKTVEAPTASLVFFVASLALLCFLDSRDGSDRTCLKSRTNSSANCIELRRQIGCECYPTFMYKLHGKS